MSLLTLTEYANSRIFIAGALEGEYYKLIDFLFTEEFSYKDILVLTGNFVNSEKVESEKLISFVREHNNIFSVKGKNEKSLVEDINDNPPIFDITQKDFEFLESLPLVIELNNQIYVVNSGYSSNVSLEEQTPEYTIYNVDEWYNKEQQAAIFCFTNEKLNKVKVNSGYNLGSIKNSLTSLILYKDCDPILITI